MAKQQNPMEQLERALEAESLEWMLSQHPEIVDAIQTALEEGATAEDVKWAVMRITGPGRWEIAKRCELVAKALGA